MGQQRITRYVTYDKSPETVPAKCGFLDLSPQIRRRIYRETGIGTYRLINMNYGITHNNKEYETQSATIHGDPFRIQAPTNKRFSMPCQTPLSLLYVCHIIHDEVEQILYAENHFAITRRDPGGLQPLESISNMALRELRTLAVCLNISSCITACCRTWIWRCGNRRRLCRQTRFHDVALGNVSWADKQIIAQWQRICRRFVENIRPGQLALYITCDCKDQDTAGAVIQPLLATPILDDCALRLAIRPLPELTNLAREAVLRLTTGYIRNNTTPFRFADLPEEIRLQILEYTPLVQRHGEISLRSHSRLVFSQECRNQGIAVAKYQDGDHWPYSENYLLKCFCRQEHSAFSFACACIKFPFSYFLVNKWFRHMALQIFFSKNQFRVSTSNSNTGFLPFLTWLPRQAIPFLTSIYLFLDLVEPPSTGQDATSWENWLETIETLQSEGNIRALCLTLRLSIWEPVAEDVEPSLNLKSEHIMLISGKLQAMFKPMKVLRHLQRLRIHLYLSLRHNTHAYQSRWWSEEWISLEKSLEKFIIE